MMALIDAAALRAKIDCERADIVRELEGLTNVVERAERSGTLEGLRIARGLVNSMPETVCEQAAPLPHRAKGGRKPDASSRVMAHLAAFPADRNLTGRQLANKLGVGPTTAAKAIAAFRER